ncbi:hypothetical protein BVC93_16275 [Mycobacterium sp. MS1601]|uniref:CbtA family protein n=1 Tax=Mycobacterium sp. MS1601 TaxID=1936029 RepID=UPI00097924A1|nr:CbtA family protein [Mycobacterium sp. MS1601]AQA03722.1 hypothetical protein BVC93_16275 [Mycobacterium sp. MS1601]
MEKRLISLGLGAGLLAGVASFAYARIQAAPLIAGAIEYEEARSHAEEAAGGGHSHEQEVFTRAVQENLGAGVGTIAFAVITGALFAVALSITLATLRRHRIAFDTRAVAAVLAGVAFIAVCVVPWIAYPATLPGVGQPETAGARTTAYLALLITSLVLAALAGVGGLRLAPRIGGYAAAATGIAGYLVAVSVAITVLPSYRETPQPVTGPDGTVVFPGFPADLLADFRIITVVCQGILWLVMGAAFAVLLPRVLGITRNDNRTEVLSAHR